MPPTLQYAPSAGTPPGLSNYGQTLLGRFDRSILVRPYAHVVLAVLLGVLLIIPSVQAVRAIRQVESSLFRSGGERHRTALGRWLPDAEALTRLKEGENPYGYGHWFPTPPLVLIGLVPFWKMGYTAAGIVWAVLKIAGFTTAMALLVRELRRTGLPVPLGVLLMAAVFAARPVVGDIQHGNLNIFMMVWIAIAWTLYLRGNDLWAGLFVALAIVTKVTPALLLLYFLYKRAWGVCIGAGVGLVLFFILIPGLFLGFDQNIALLRDWFDMLVAPFALHGYVTLEIPNQSLNGVALRLLSNAGIIPIEHMSANQALAAGMESMARPVTTAGRLLRPIISLVFLAALAWSCRLRTVRRHDIRSWMEFSLILLAMLLLSERTWKHHATTLPIVFLAFWLALTCLPWSPRYRGWHVAGLAVQFLLLVGSGELIFGDRIADLLLDGGVFCWGLLLCFLQIAFMAAAMDAPSPSRPAATAP